MNHANHNTNFLQRTTYCTKMIVTKFNKYMLHKYCSNHMMLQDFERATRVWSETLYSRNGAAAEIFPFGCWIVIRSTVSRWRTMKQDLAHARSRRGWADPIRRARRRPQRARDKSADACKQKKTNHSNLQPFLSQQLIRDSISQQVITAAHRHHKLRKA